MASKHEIRLNILKKYFDNMTLEETKACSTKVLNNASKMSNQFRRDVSPDLKTESLLGFIDINIRDKVYDRTVSEGLVFAEDKFYYKSSYFRTNMVYYSEIQEIKYFDPERYGEPKIYVRLKFDYTKSKVVENFAVCISYLFNHLVIKAFLEEMMEQEKLCVQETKQYWIDNVELKNKYLNEINNIEEKIKLLTNERNKYSGKISKIISEATSKIEIEITDKITELDKEIYNLERQLSGLGFFSVSKKKKLKQQIAMLTNQKTVALNKKSNVASRMLSDPNPEIAKLLEEIDNIDADINNLKKQINDINHELTRER